MVEPLIGDMPFQHNLPFPTSWFRRFETTGSLPDVPPGSYLNFPVQVSRDGWSWLVLLIFA